MENATLQNPLTIIEAEIERVMNVAPRSDYVRIPVQVAAACRTALAAQSKAGDQRTEVERLWAEQCIAVGHELTDVEAEDALTSEGIYTWGPDGERFERMFAVVMKLRAARIHDPDAATGCADDFSPITQALAGQP